MQINIEQTSINDVKVIVPEVFRDDRGFFSEVYRSDQFNDLGLPTNFVQDNQSGSGSGVIRGLHFQWEPPMGKLIGVTVGKVFLVAVDIRKNSPTLGNWVGLEVSAENRKMLCHLLVLLEVCVLLLIIAKYNISAQVFIIKIVSRTFFGMILILVLNGQ